MKNGRIFYLEVDVIEVQKANVRKILGVTIINGLSAITFLQERVFAIEIDCSISCVKT